MSIKFKKAFYPFLSICLTGAITGCSLLPVEEEELKPPLVQPVQAPIKVADVIRQDVIRQITGVATFNSDKKEHLFFEEASGRLLKINVKLNDVVKPGDLIAEINTDNLVTDIQLKENDVEKIQIDLQKQIVEKGEEHPDVRSKKIDLNSAQIQLDKLKSRLQKSRLISNISGIVTGIDESLKPGDNVTAYKDVVVVSDPTQMQLIYLGSNAADLAAVTVGMPVDIKVGDKQLKGKVVQTPNTRVQTGDSAIDSRNEKALIINVEGITSDITMGSPADINIILEKRENSVVIPRGALRTYMTRNYVQVLEGTDSRREIDVEVGIIAPTQVEIIKGLEEGMKVIMPN